MKHRFLRSTCLIGTLLTVPEILPASDYELTAIPSQTVWQNETLEFTFEWTGHPGATLTYEFDPLPEGTCSITDAATPPGWLFRYECGARDAEAVRVRVQAADGGDSAEQEFMVMPLLPSYEFVLGTGHGSPSENSIGTGADHSITTKGDGTKVLMIVGQNVEIRDGHLNGLLDQLKSNDAYDEVEISCQHLVVASGVETKGADVTINAETLRFVDDGMISTQPTDYDLGPRSTEEALPGQHGKPGGDVRLLVRELSIENDSTVTPTIKTCGGRGQQNGPAVQGDRGEAPTQYWLEHELLGGPDPGPDHRVHVIEYKLIDGWGNPIQSPLHPYDFPAPPQKSQNPGQPGNGGSGGSVMSTVAVNSFNRGSLAGHLDLSGGAKATLYANEYGYDETDTNVSPARSLRSLYEDSGKYAVSRATTPPLNGQVPKRFKQLEGYYYWDVWPVVGRWILSKKEAQSAVGGRPSPNWWEPTNVDGSPGQLDATTLPPDAWINPAVIRHIIRKARNHYLNNELAAAGALLRDYIPLVEQRIVVLEAASAGLPEAPDELTDLDQQLNEMRLMVQRIETGVDYFGNPPGWAPLLNLEFTKAAFDSEIDSAIESIFRIELLKKHNNDDVAHKAALADQRDQTWGDLEEAKETYDGLMANLDTMSAEREAIEQEIGSLQNDLWSIEREIEQNLNADFGWAIYAGSMHGIRLGCKVGAAICKAAPIPGIQPYLGELGGGALKVVGDTDIKGIIDGTASEDWWLDSINDSANVVNSTVAAKFKSTETALNQTKLDITTHADKFAQYKKWKQARKSTQAVTDGITDVTSYLKEMGTPMNIIEEELHRRMATSPELANTYGLIDLAMNRKLDFNIRFLDLSFRLAESYDAIDQHLLAVGALSRDAAAAPRPIDPRVMGHLDELSARAWDRLFKYYYYFVKAYQYRVLRDDIDVFSTQAMIDELKSKVTARIHDGDVDYSQIENAVAIIKDIYDDQVRVAGNAIYENYLNNYTEHHRTVIMEITPEQLDVLNQGGGITINPKEDGLFQDREENLRIRGINVVAIDAQPVTGAFNSEDFLDIAMVHRGVSLIQSEKKVYRFTHYNQETKNPILWSSRYRPLVAPNIQLMDEPNLTGGGTLLSSFLSSEALNKYALFARPGAWADLDLYLSPKDNAPTEYLVTRLLLEIDYAFSHQGSDNRDLEVRVLADGGAGNGAEISPVFKTDLADVNDLQCAAGEFRAIYRASDVIEITAAASAGGWNFVKWVDRFGNDIGGVPHTSPTIQLSPATGQVSDHFIQAVYAPPPPEPPVVVMSPPSDGLALRVGPFTDQSAVYKVWVADAPNGPWSLYAEFQGSGFLKSVDLEALRGEREASFLRVEASRD